MTHLVAKFNTFFFPKKTDENNSVFDFFVEKKSGERKKTYINALKAAENDQKMIIKMAEEKMRA